MLLLVTCLEHEAWTVKTSGSLCEIRDTGEMASERAVTGKRGVRQSQCRQMTLTIWHRFPKIKSVLNAHACVYFFMLQFYVPIPRHNQFSYVSLNFLMKSISESDTNLNRVATYLAGICSWGSGRPGSTCAGVESGIWTWHKSWGFHDLISFLGSDYHFTWDCGDSVCKGSRECLGKTLVNC